MKLSQAVTAGALLMLLGALSPAYAQHDQQGMEEGRPVQRQQQHQQQQQHQRQTQPTRQQHAQPAQQQHAQPAQRQQQRATRPTQSQRRPQSGMRTYRGAPYRNPSQHQRQTRSGFDKARATSWNTEHRSWRQRGGYTGYRIPADRYRRYFGRDHHFHIRGLPLIFVGGYPRFQYNGYWITFVDPWPESWSPTWYETDDVYLDYTDDGYYLYDTRYPGVAIAVTIAF